MRVGLLQFDPSFGERDRNVEHVLKGLAGAQVELIVLPELFDTGYQFTSKEEAYELAEEIPGGKTSTRLAEFCRETRMFIVAGMAERVGAKTFNSAALFGPNGHIGTYRKTHLFYEEKLWFEPGDTGFKVFDIGGVKLGLMVCFDWIFPESSRTLALMGADIICHPSNLVLPYCPDAMAYRCLENRVFAITCNRTGFEERGGKERLTFIGKSEIVSPKGEILERASEVEDALIVVDIDPLQARDKQLNRYNNLLGDRRPEMYL
ncbi:MAG: nitrilase-related carbon-nitrogen hydrolase [Candidatus Aquicultor sp.]|nr:nitrilase-related carbon-nitrogen hydrolase [Candidatus Aquicultor sp.]